MNAVLSPCDAVIVQYPCYQSLEEVLCSVPHGRKYDLTLRRLQSLAGAKSSGGIAAKRTDGRRTLSSWRPSLLLKRKESSYESIVIIIMTSLSTEPHSDNQATVQLAAQSHRIHVQQRGTGAACVAGSAALPFPVLRRGVPRTRPLRLRLVSSPASLLRRVREGRLAWGNVEGVRPRGAPHRLDRHARHRGTSYLSREFGGFSRFYSHLPPPFLSFMDPQLALQRSEDSGQEADTGMEGLHHHLRLCSFRVSRCARSPPLRFHPLPNHRHQSCWSRSGIFPCHANFRHP